MIESANDLFWNGAAVGGMFVAIIWYAYWVYQGDNDGY